MTTITNLKKGIDLKCSICGYEWEYKGTKKIQATCPDCMRKIRIEKCKKKT